MTEESVTGCNTDHLDPRIPYTVEGWGNEAEKWVHH